jgi:hypothetical protein
LQYQRFKSWLEPSRHRVLICMNFRPRSSHHLGTIQIQFKCIACNEFLVYLSIRIFRPQPPSNSLVAFPCSLRYRALPCRANGQVNASRFLKACRVQMVLWESGNRQSDNICLQVFWTLSTWVANPSLAQT